jgi:hypothetical protein
MPWSETIPAACTSRTIGSIEITFLPDESGAVLLFTRRRGAQRERHRAAGPARRDLPSAGGSPACGLSAPA